MKRIAAVLMILAFGAACGGSKAANNEETANQGAMMNRSAATDSSMMQQGMQADSSGMQRDSGKMADTTGGMQH